MTTTKTPPRVMSLSEIATFMGMKRPNVAKFLARRDVHPIFEKAQGAFWAAEDIERVKAEREADEAKLEADRRRRESALRGPLPPEPPKPPELARLGPSQRALLERLMKRPIKQPTEPERFALRRLRDRGLADTVPGEPGTWKLTRSGRKLAAEL